MNKKVKISGYILAVVLVLIQFYPTDKPLTYANNPNDLLQNNQVPDNISSILKSACYDCHSYETKYPWYASITPLKWLIYSDINKGREELNFSNWNTINKEEKADILDDISTVLLEEEMPLKKYTYFHSEAKLSLEDREEISNWAELILENLYN